MFNINAYSYTQGPIVTAYIDQPTVAARTLRYTAKPSCNVVYIKPGPDKPTYRLPPGKHHPAYRYDSVPVITGAF